jgi:Hydrolytic ATP binding site of dynein motor region
LDDISTNLFKNFICSTLLIVTGKTESVKALGAALGRFVLVFNCDETFDFSAMGRLLAGLSQVGAWVSNGWLPGRV